MCRAPVILNLFKKGQNKEAKTAKKQKWNNEKKKRNDPCVIAHFPIFFFIFLNQKETVFRTRLPTLPPHLYNYRASPAPSPRRSRRSVAPHPALCGRPRRRWGCCGTRRSQGKSCRGSGMERDFPDMKFLKKVPLSQNQGWAPKIRRLSSLPQT